MPQLGLARKQTPESLVLRALARDALVERNNCGGQEQNTVRQGEAGLQYRDFSWPCLEFAAEVASWCWPTMSSKDWNSFSL